MIRHPLNWAVCHGCRLHSNYLQHGSLEHCALIGQSPTFSHVYRSVWFVHLSHRAASHQGDTFQKKILESVSCISFLASLSIWQTAAPGNNHTTLGSKPQSRVGRHRCEDSLSISSEKLFKVIQHKARHAIPLFTSSFHPCFPNESSQPLDKSWGNLSLLFQ